MSKRAIHYDDFEPSPCDTDGPDTVFCGVTGEFEQEHFTRYEDQVTCRRCLLSLASLDRKRAAQRAKDSLAREAWAEECAF